MVFVAAMIVRAMEVAMHESLLAMAGGFIKAQYSSRHVVLWQCCLTQQALVLLALQCQTLSATSCNIARNKYSTSRMLQAVGCSVHPAQGFFWGSSSMQCKQSCVVGIAIPLRGAMAEVELVMVKQVMVSVVHMGLDMGAVGMTEGTMTEHTPLVMHIAAGVQLQLEKGHIPGLALSETMDALQREQEVRMIALLAAWPLDSSTAEALPAAQHLTGTANTHLHVTP